MSQLDRIEHLLLSQFHLINYWSEKIMLDITQLQAQVEALTAAASADKAAAAASAAKVDTAVGLLQALSASIADLKAQLGAGNAITQADIDALTAKASAALTDLTASAATETAADAALDAGVAGNTPTA
jgi:hypothetical protein